MADWHGQYQIDTSEGKVDPRGQCHEYLSGSPGTTLGPPSEAPVRPSRPAFSILTRPPPMVGGEKPQQADGGLVIGLFLGVRRLNLRCLT